MGVTVHGSFPLMKQMVRAMGNPETVLPAVGAEALRLVTMGFEKEKDPRGKAWAPFRRWHIKTKRFSGEVATRDGKLLQNSGLLKNSFRYVVGGRTVTVLTDIPYAGTHQFGATIKPKSGNLLSFKVGGPNGRRFRRFAKSVKVPARPMVPTDSGISATWAWSIRFAIVKALRAEASRAR